MNDQLQTIVNLLPPSGTMSYDNWISAMQAAGINPSWRLIQRARKTGAVVFACPTGLPADHVVSRAQGQG